MNDNITCNLFSSNQSITHKIISLQEPIPSFVTTKEYGFDGSLLMVTVICKLYNNAIQVYKKHRRS
jgi:hypothetical protein